MNTNDDIEVHELQAIEQRLNTEAAPGATTQDASAASEAGFEVV